MRYKVRLSESIVYNYISWKIIDACLKEWNQYVLSFIFTFIYSFSYSYSVVATFYILTCSFRERLPRIS